MECASVRELLTHFRRGRLDLALGTEARAHLEACDACRQAEAVEASLDQALAEWLPRYLAPPALRRHVEDLVLTSRGTALAVPVRQRSQPALRRFLAPVAFAAMAILTAGVLVQQQVRRRGDAFGRVADEVVTDHLRLLVSAHPNDLESGLNHQVKPWFEGRLDFAPVVPGDRGELQLLGGAVGYVIDREAAVMSYALGRHRVTLLAFPASGLTWPPPNRSAGGVLAHTTLRRGFDVVMWRAGDLAYALVSDVSAQDLEKLATELAPETRR